MPVEEVEETVTIKRKRLVYTCDGCGRKTVVSLYKCFICGKEFCSDCYRYIPDDHKIWHGDNQWCCNSCWNIGKDSIEYLNGIEHGFKAMVEEELRGWKKLVSGH